MTTAMSCADARSWRWGWRSSIPLGAAPLFAAFGLVPVRGATSP